MGIERVWLLLQLSSCAVARSAQGVERGQATPVSNAFEAELRLTLDQLEELAVQGLVTGHDDSAFDSGGSALPVGNLAAGLFHEGNGGSHIPGVEIWVNISIQAPAGYVGQTERC